MSSNSIGKIIQIDSQNIVAELYNDVGNYLNTIDGIRFVGEIGSYVSISEFDRKIIAEIISVEDKNFISNKPLSKPLDVRVTKLNLIGEISNYGFTFGVSKMPLLFSEIDIITENELHMMLDIGEAKEEIISDNKTRLISLEIGQSVVFPDYSVNVNIDKFFGFHFAIFGNTGAGKSNTIARILQNIFQKQNCSAKGAKFVIFDSNGEYGNAFEKLNDKNCDINYKYMSCDTDKNIHFEIPAWALSADDWAILLHASEKTQIPVLKRAIDIAKVFFDPDGSDDEVKNHILASTVLGILNSSDSTSSKGDKIKTILTQFGTDEFKLSTNITETAKTLNDYLTISYGEMKDLNLLIEYCESFIRSDSTNIVINKAVPYDLNEFSQAVQFATLYEGSLSSQRIQEYTSTLSTRLQTISDGNEGKIFVKTNFESIGEYIENLLGNNQILDLDISMLDDSACEVITKVLSKLILDFLRKLPNKADMPVNLIIEEAHRFIKDNHNAGAIGYNVFERIAKEGRKYGLLMGISSQRPSELSKTVVSQCSNFIIHRVQNPDDLNYISKMVPYINRSILDRLTYLQTGHALVFGTAINLPTLTKFDEADPNTDSSNAKISEHWYIE